MTSKVKDLTSQSEIVVKQLMINQKVNRMQAIDIWYNSKTKRALEERSIYFVSGMRCYIELMYELNNNSKWMTDSFE